MSDSDGSTTSSSYDQKFGLPKNYSCIGSLGSGGFGKVLKCWDSDTRSMVAIKIPQFEQDTKHELTILRKLKLAKCHHYNIVNFIGSFNICHGQGLVFETLDISLHEFIFDLSKGPLRVSEIRAVVKQMASALNALKDLGIIHTDIKEDNILLEQCKQPLRVKLIDFGLAITKDQIKQGSNPQFRNIQLTCLRAPELLLGLPFSEAIDMWSLGCVMYSMVRCEFISEADTPYQAIQTLVDLLGMPSDELLNTAPGSPKFFIKRKNGNWRLKTRKEVDNKCHPFTRTHRGFRLDQLKRERLEKQNKFEAEEREQCIELLKAILVMDGSRRITPAEVLLHQFITGIKSTHSSGVTTSVVIEVQPALAENRLELAEDRTTNDQHRPFPLLPSFLKWKKSTFRGNKVMIRKINLQPASPENICELCDDPSKTSAPMFKDAKTQTTDGLNEVNLKTRKTICQHIQSWFR